jgi:hypothetical protein
MRGNRANQSGLVLCTDNLKEICFVQIAGAQDVTN